MLSTFAVLLALVPQGDVRSAGRVLDQSGQPVSGASVTFLSRPIPRSLEAEPADRRIVRTDERGMFRVELKESARYTVWAAWDQAATGFAEGALAGEFLELRGVPATEPLVFDLVGTEAWPEASTFRLRAIVGGENIDFAEVERDGGKWRVPALPPKTWRTIEVLDGRGQVLWADGTQRVEGGFELRLPPPVEHTVEVVDDDGAPIAGADVYRHVRNYWYSESESLPYGDRFRSLWPVVGTSDAQGKVTVRVAWEASEQDLWLLTKKDGYAMSLDGTEDGRRFVNGNVIKKGDEPDGSIRATLKKGEPVELSLRDDHDLPLADRWLFLVGRVYVSNGNSASGMPLNLTLPVTQGRARLLSQLPPSTEIEIAEIVLSDRRSAALSEQHGFTPRRVWRLPHPEKLLSPDDEAPIALEESRVLQVTAADGRPAARAIVFFVDALGHNEQQVMRRTDRMGRALLPKGRELRIGVLGAGGIGATRIAADGDGEIKLQLQALVPLALRVVDQQGNPVAGVGVQVDPQHGGDDAEDDLVWCAASLLSLRTEVASDAAGRIALPLPPRTCTVGLTCERRRTVTGDSLEWDPKSREVHELVVGPAR